MPLYKTLRAAGMNEHLLNSQVESGWETWASLDAALNELGAAGWEIATPLYGSLPGLAQRPTTWPMAIILTHRSADAAMETQRQIDKLKHEIAETNKKFGPSARVKELQGILEGLVKNNPPLT